MADLLALMTLTMQALTLTRPDDPYNAGMNTGRPAKHPRPPFGQRLHDLREQAGLSQEQLAKKLGIAQRTYSQWERRPVALRHDQLEAVADALGISTAEMMGAPDAQKRGTGPAGKLRQVFERASKLPRDQQKHVVRVIEDTLTAYGVRKAG
jgi:transcriptional regulator with XRE-family HTH domain